MFYKILLVSIKLKDFSRKNVELSGDVIYNETKSRTDQRVERKTLKQRLKHTLVTIPALVPAVIIALIVSGRGGLAPGISGTTLFMLPKRKKKKRPRKQQVSISRHFWK